MQIYVIIDYNIEQHIIIIFQPTTFYTMYIMSKIIHKIINNNQSIGHNSVMLFICVKVFRYEYNKNSCDWEG